MRKESWAKQRRRRIPECRIRKKKNQSGDQTRDSLVLCHHATQQEFRVPRALSDLSVDAVQGRTREVFLVCRQHRSEQAPPVGRDMKKTGTQFAVSDMYIPPRITSHGVASSFTSSRDSCLLTHGVLARGS